MGLTFFLRTKTGFRGRRLAAEAMVENAEEGFISTEYKTNLAPIT